MMRSPVRSWSAFLVMLIATFFAVPEVRAESDGDVDIALMVGRSHVVTSEQRISQVIVVDQSVADAEVIGARRLILYGRRLGSTDVILQFEDDTTTRYILDITLDAVSLQSRLDSLFGRGLIVDLDDGVLVLNCIIAYVSDNNP